MTEKCVRYTATLAHFLSLICKWFLVLSTLWQSLLIMPGHPDASQGVYGGTRLGSNSVNDLSMQTSSEAQLHDFSGLLSSSDLDMGTSFDEFFGADFSGITYFSDLVREINE